MGTPVWGQLFIPEMNMSCPSGSLGDSSREQGVLKVSSAPKTTFLTQSAPRDGDPKSQPGFTPPPGGGGAEQTWRQPISRRATAWLF